MHQPSTPWALLLTCGLFLNPCLHAQDAPAHSGPGLYVRISAEFLGAGFAQPVDKASPVDIAIRKYHVRGSAHVVGQMSFQPLPCADQLRLKMTLSGEAVGHDTSQLRCLVVHTVDRSRICVQQEVFVNSDGVRAGELQSLSAPTRSEFRFAHSGRPPLRDALVAGLARTQFRLMPRKTNQIATEVSETVLRQDLEHDLPATLAKANQKFREQFLEPLNDLEIPGNGVHFSSTADAVEIRLDVPGVQSKPAPAPANSDLCLRVHEATLNRTLRQIYGGSTQLGKDLEAEIGRALAFFAPAPPKKTDGQGLAWSVKFNKQDPIAFQFDKNKMRVTLHGDSAKVGNDEFPEMIATLVYELQHTPTGWRAVRSESVTVVAANPEVAKKLTRRQEIMKGFLALKLSQIFGAELDFANAELPDTLGSAKGAVSRLATHDGWLVLEWAMRR